MPVPGNSGKRVITITPLHIKTSPVKFSSIITQYADTWTPQWRQEFVYGRMDPISFYGGTDRKLTLGFRVVSENKYEAAINMRSIQRLLQLQYPTFDTQFGEGPQQAIATVKAPPYFKLKVFNVANVGSEHVQGYFNGPITINPGFADKTKNQYYTAGNNKLMFSDVEISLQMIVLHQKKVGFYGDKFGGLGGAYPYNISGGPSAPPQDTVVEVESTSEKAEAQETLALDQTPAGGGTNANGDVVHHEVFDPANASTFTAQVSQTPAPTTDTNDERTQSVVNEICRRRS